MVIVYDLYYAVYYLSSSKAVACLLNQVVYLHMLKILLHLCDSVFIFDK